MLAREKRDGSLTRPLGPLPTRLVGDGEQGLDDVLCPVVQLLGQLGLGLGEGFEVFLRPRGCRAAERQRLGADFA